MRLRALGGIDGSLYVVVFTDRLDRNGASVRWIISARRAHRKERRKWSSDP
ncbi:BrnT family toxin [Methylobacterium symbioticum]|uniref:BrnT family toxin n=1 Tax=Methylobacterium symbioticum TaxID=2584084 RepID=UPI00099BB12F